jgi:hypothetical protein
MAVEKCYDTGEYETVYNCRVEGWHTYYVGDEGWCFDVWAHNAKYQPDPKDVAAYKAQRQAGAVDWNRINPNLTVKQQSAIRKVAREQGMAIPTPNPHGKKGDPVSKRTGTYAVSELRKQGFPSVEREQRFLTPHSPYGKAHRDADVLAINSKTKEAVIVQVVRTTNKARTKPHPRELDAMNDIRASPRYQDLVQQGYTITSYMMRRGSTSLSTGVLKTFK